MKQTQLLKGVLDGCVLALISGHELYGYELIQALRATGFDSIVGGTLYPLLAKLEKNGDLVSRMRASPDGPDRKYYRLTPQGRQTLAAFDAQWHQLTNQVATILERVTKDD
ncbi:PadR family transcriptional regulator [Lacticaseibacillus absianus]|uniref:PadR family transcriptional regulator n=1 Tax=Lacticaseibacillus absianus TaxID=2729623 RepID=UPI0015C707B1|nr:PadR family transcriptional regulator [Lacticaseibacillus absianus]